MKLNRVILALFVIAAFVVGGLFFNKKSFQRSAKSSSAITQKAPKSFSQSSSAVQKNPNHNELAATISSELRLTAVDHWKNPMPEPAFARFHDWSEKYIHSSLQDRTALLPEGIALAQSRRKELAALIQSDPKRALELTVPMAVRESLPSGVVELLEQRVGGRGELAVLAALAEPGKENEVVPTWRTANIGKTEYQAFVYGRRLGEPTRFNIPLNGIALDNLFAVNENPVRVLEPAEAAAEKPVATETVCSVSGLNSTVINQEVAVAVADETIFLCRPDHIEALNERLTAAESGPPNGAEEGQEPEASAWTEGQKGLILIRVDFSDLAGGPFSETTGTNLIFNLDTFYTVMSYGVTGFKLVGEGSEVTPVFRMPHSAAYYGTNNYASKLRTDARAAATAAGYVLTNYNLDVTCMGAVPGFGWAGLGVVGGAGAWIRNTSSTGVTGHELGHNYGLNHANSWDTGGKSIIGAGTSSEYGDSFDTMGFGSAGSYHFNVRYKRYLNWLSLADTPFVTSNGTYRISAHDYSTATGIRGLRITKTSSKIYWVEFRQKFTGNQWLMNGAGLRWAQSGNQKSLLLDTTPGSTDGKNDSAIVIGRTFSDSEAGIHITPIGKGGTSPESLDVVVNFGSVATNVPPTLALVAPVTNATSGATLNFSANASDANGDELAYYWDFGDGNFGTNGATASKSWSGGQYVVRCTVTDMKGGTASDSVIVVIGSPTTFRISGQVSGTNSVPVQNVRVYVSSTRMTYTDTDGTYNLVGLPAGTYTVSTSLEDYSFNANFSNPVSVGPNKTGINFSAELTNSPPVIPELLLSDTFSYEAGTSLDGQGGWVLNSGIGGTNENGSLSVDGLASSTSNRVTWGADAVSLRLPFGINVTTGSVYFSFAMRADTLGSSFITNGTLAGFTTGTGTSFGTKINIRTNGIGGFNLGVSKAGGTTFGNWATTNFNASEIIFIVGRYTFKLGSSTDDTCDLWLNPNSATFGATNPPTPTIAVIGSGGTDLAQIDRFFFRSGGSNSSPSKLVGDELRVGFKWAAVTPTSPDVGPPLTIYADDSTATIVWPTDLSDGFVLQQTTDFPSTNWIAVTNDVVVFDASNSVTIDIAPATQLYFRLKK